MSTGLAPLAVLKLIGSAGTTVTKLRRQQILDAVRQVKAGCSKKTRKEMTEDEFIELMRIMDQRNREWKEVNSGGDGLKKMTHMLYRADTWKSLGDIMGTPLFVEVRSSLRDAQGKKRRRRRNARTRTMCCGTSPSRSWGSDCAPTM